MKRALAWLSCVLVATAAAGARADEKEVCASAAERSEVLMRQSRFVEARVELAVCSRASCPKVVQADCKKWLDDVQAQQSGVVLRASDAAGQAVTPARVLVDSIAVAVPAGGEPIAVDPGAHTIRVEAPGLEAAEATITLQAGDRRHPISLTLRRTTPVPAPPPPPPTEAPPPVEQSSATPPSSGVETPPLEASTRSRVAPWILGGAGVAAMGVGAVLWLIGTGERSDLYDRCGNPGTCTSDDIDSSRSSSQTKLVFGDVAFGLGLGAVAGAVLWMLVSPDHPDGEKTSFVPTPGGVGLRW